MGSGYPLFPIGNYSKSKTSENGRLEVKLHICNERGLKNPTRSFRCHYFLSAQLSHNLPSRCRVAIFNGISPTGLDKISLISHQMMEMPLIFRKPTFTAVNCFRFLKRSGHRSEPISPREARKQNHYKFDVKRISIINKKSDWIKNSMRYWFMDLFWLTGVRQCPPWLRVTRG